MSRNIETIYKAGEIRERSYSLPKGPLLRFAFQQECPVAGSMGIHLWIVYIFVEIICRAQPRYPASAPPTCAKKWSYQRACRGREIVFSTGYQKFVSLLFFDGDCHQLCKEL
jgi:hypothetical protein